MDGIFPDFALFVLDLFKICTYLIIYKQAVTKIEIRHLAKAQKSLASRPKISRTRESRPKKVQTNKYQINNPVFVVMIIHTIYLNNYCIQRVDNCYISGSLEVWSQ